MKPRLQCVLAQWIPGFTASGSGTFTASGSGTFTASGSGTFTASGSGTANAECQSGARPSQGRREGAASVPSGQCRR